MTRKSHFGAAAFAAMLTLSACGPSYMETARPPMKNIVQVASENGSFNTLVAAVKAAGLAETLQGPGPFTVFAPTDAAFALKKKAFSTPAVKTAFGRITYFHVKACKIAK